MHYTRVYYWVSSWWANRIGLASLTIELFTQTLVTAAMKGVGIGLGVALPILTFATSNIITGLLATCSIIFSTLAVIAVIPLGGWKLGVSHFIHNPNYRLAQHV